MRYPDGGGLTAEGRARREKVRLQAAQMFEQEMDPVRVARCLRVSTNSAYQWRRCWRAGGEAALAQGKGKADARANGLATAAASLYTSESARARIDAQTIARDAAPVSGPRLRARLLAFETQAGIARVALTTGSRVIADVGDRTAVAQGLATLEAPAAVDR